MIVRLQTLNSSDAGISSELEVILVLADSNINKTIITGHRSVQVYIIREELSKSYLYSLYLCRILSSMLILYSEPVTDPWNCKPVQYFTCVLF